MGISIDSSLFERISASRIIAVLVVDSADAAVGTAKALLDGGVDAIELTLRTPAALGALRAVREQVPDILAGVGTILSAEQADQALDAGAAFGVSPGINAEVVSHASQIGLPFAPGIMTPTDVDLAVANGCQVQKFFPATSAGGLSHLKNIAAPYAHLGVQFIPLGGVTRENLSEWLASPLVPAVGGSWLAPRELIANEDWHEIARRAKDARAVADL